MTKLLRNPVWESLEGAHATLKYGCALAGRYPGDVVPLAAVHNSGRDAVEALARVIGRCEQFYFLGESLPAHPSLRLLTQASAVQMIFEPASVPTARAGRSSQGMSAQGMKRLSEADGAAMIALARASQNDYLRGETLRLGEFLGIFDGGVLAAMAGERLCAGHWREIAAVCTHPDYRGRGFAARLILELAARAEMRGERSFLHVDTANTGARALYRKLGFIELGAISVQRFLRTA